MSAPIVDAAQAMAGLLRTAEDGELPTPYDACASRFAPNPHPAYGTDAMADGGITLMVDTLEDLAAWATWLDEPIDDSHRTNGRVHARVHGYAGPVPVTVIALMPADAEVSA